MTESPLTNFISDRLSPEGRAAAEQLLRGLDDINRKTSRLATILAEMAEGDRKLFIDGFPVHYQQLWRNLLKVGQGEMHPKLVTASGRTAQVLRKLPYADQEHYIDNLIEVVIGDGPRAVKRFDIESMPAEFMPQVFAQGGSAARVRDIEEQRKWRRLQADKKAAQDAHTETTEINRPNRWAIRNGRAHLAPALVAKGLTIEDVEKLRADLKL
jgi:hypothetical protein